VRADEPTFSTTGVPLGSGRRALRRSGTPEAPRRLASSFTQTIQAAHGSLRVTILALLQVGAPERAPPWSISQVRG
ncbi:MAG: hypothetical protein ACRDXD_15860, partial [Acidimicrobiia bacterium]